MDTLISFCRYALLPEMILRVVIGKAVGNALGIPSCNAYSQQIDVPGVHAQTISAEFIPRPNCKAGLALVHGIACG
jgi:hypothetical protein